MTIRSNHNLQNNPNQNHFERKVSSIGAEVNLNSSLNYVFTNTILVMFCDEMPIRTQIISQEKS
jgi:hypothetical protein